MATTYIVTDPHGHTHKIDSRDGYAFAIVRQFEHGENFSVSLSATEESAKKTLSNRRKVAGVVVKLDENGVGAAPLDRQETIKLTGSMVEIETENKPPAVKPTVSESFDFDDETLRQLKEEIYAEAFAAGKDYALKCAFEGVEEPPANPYTKETYDTPPGFVFLGGKDVA